MTWNIGPTARSLTRLLDDSLATAALSVGTTEAVHRVLDMSPEVLELRKDVERGTLTEGQIESFVAKLQERFVRGQRFIGDVPFSALAVALERWRRPYAKQFLDRLASLAVSELPMSRQIAALVLRRRAQHIGGMTASVYQVSSPLTAAASPNVVSPRRISTGGGPPSGPVVLRAA
jgi:hypothetical protein